MTVEAIRTERSARSRKAALMAWLWPQPLETQDKRGPAWLASLLGWMWPSATHDERFGRRHGLMAALFGWAWPSALDRGFKRFWKLSWLWSWMWPGRVMGPDGDVCALAPWHPALRAEVCVGEPWQRKISKHGGVVFMMFAATAIAAPTFMEGNGADGGRLSLFRGGADAGGGDAGAQGGDTGAGGQGGGQPGAGGVGGAGANGGAGGGAGGQGDGGGAGGFDGFGGQGPGGNGGGPTNGGDGGNPGNPGDDGVTFLDPPTSPGGDTPTDIGGGPGGFGGGFGGPGGGGGGGGGGQPTDPTGTNPTDPTTPTDPTNPTDPTAPGGGDPSGPLNPPTPPIDKPTFPTVPGDGGNGGNGGTNPSGGPSILPNNPIIEDPRGPGETPDDRGPVGAIPEPSTWAMMIMGFGAIGYVVRRRRIAQTLS